MDEALIAELNRLCARAWVALEEEWCEGWLLRAAGGYSWRANSVWPERDSDFSLDERFERAEAFYRARGLEPCFQITPVSAPRDLPAALSARGYAPHTPTMAMAGATPVGQSSAIVLGEESDAEWESVFLDSTADQADGRGRLAIIKAMRLKRRHALARVDGTPAAIGIGVLDSEWLGIYGMRTLAPFRRRGLARQVVLALGAWAARQGATRTYLQVEVDNPGAIALYRGLGLQEAYRYTYWSKELTS